MQTITQTNRKLKITSPLGENAIILTQLDGNDGLSTPFAYQLTLLSEDTQISAKQLLGQPVTIECCIDEPLLIRHGFVTAFSAGTMDYQGMRRYDMTLSPWLSLLTHTSNCRIFQNKTSIDIVKTLCQAYPLARIDSTTHLKKTHKERPYCVQYNESDFDFIHRILAEDGLFYFFEHDYDQHTLVLADQTQTLTELAQPVIYSNEIRDQQHLSTWLPQQQLQAASLSLRDYNYMKPQKNPQATTTTTNTPAKLPAKKFHYGHHLTDDAQAKEKAQQMMATQDWQSRQIQAQGNYQQLTAGLHFELESTSYLVLHCRHQAQDFTHLSGQNPQQETPAQHYQNRFTCIPSSYQFIPTMTAAKPYIISTQSATVIGPKPASPHTDALGRIQVHFHWDKNRAPDNNTAWLRVSQLSTGHAWGARFTPRVGDEVFVSFINGDPDRPIVIASVYNTINKEPYALPAHSYINGINTQLIGQNKGHELRFDDTPKQEILRIHSEGKTDMTIKNNHSHHIAGQETQTVNGNYSVKIESGQATLNAKKLTLSAGTGQIILDNSGITIQG